jgi:sigma-B regulation protein RsbU (phosphoserine phosphatase)
MAQDRLKILLLEQDTGTRHVLEEMLSEAPDLQATCEWVPSLTSGLVRLAARKDFDVILMDLFLPDGAGLGNVNLLREQAPQAPVIVLGGIDHAELALESVHAGAQDYLVKPQLSAVWLERSLRYAVETFEAGCALQAAEQKYHSVFDHLIEGIFQTTVEGRYLMANMALARIYGYNSPEELMNDLVDIGRTLYVQPNRRQEFISEMQRRDELAGFESQVYRKDGSTIWISENCRAVRDRQGQVIFYEGTVEDITSRRTAEENLRNSEALYHSLVTNLPQNIFRKDLEGRFTFANQQFCSTLGRPLHEIIGKTDYDFFPPELAKKYQVDDHNVLSTGKAYDTVEENQPSGRSKVYVQVVKTPLYGVDGRPIGLQGIFWDITAQKLADEKIRRANSQLALSRKQLREKNREMEDDLKMAKEIQLAMLPQQYPIFPVASGSEISAIQFNHEYLPAGTVGGDFFTVSALSETEASVFVCDVAGHGIRSALVTAMIRALVEELKPVALDPGKFLEKLNADLCSILKNTGSPLLTTALYLVANAATGQVVWANAGHPKPVIVERSTGNTRLMTHHAGRNFPALGLFEDAKYEWSEICMAPGDLVLLFTDGLVEVHNQKEELFTEGQLQAALSRHMILPSNQLLKRLLTEIQEFSQGSRFDDDVCLVAMDYVGRTAKKV